MGLLDILFPERPKHCPSCYGVMSWANGSEVGDGHYFCMACRAKSDKKHSERVRQEALRQLNNRLDLSFEEKSAIILKMDGKKICTGCNRTISRFGLCPNCGK